MRLHESSDRYLSSDLLPVRPGERMAIRFELYPSSCIVRAGDRIRLTLAGADADNLVAPTIGDTATLRVTLDGDRAFRRPQDPPLRAAIMQILAQPPIAPT